MDFIVENETELVEKVFSFLSDKLKAPFRVALIGDLGAGKTTLVKGLAKKLGVSEPVTSPTFTICKIYCTDSAKIQHLDLYRYSKEADEREITEYIDDPDSITFVEWPENINYPLTSYDARIRLAHTDKSGQRKVEIDAS